MTTSILQQQTIDAMPGNWSEILPFNQFDPSTGTLQNAIFTTTGTVSASASIENLAPVAATVNLGVAANISASVAGIGSVASIEPLAVASVDLPAFRGTFNGIVDFSGPSGTVVSNLSGSTSQSTVVLPGTSGGGSPLVGTGSIDVAVLGHVTSTVEGNANLAVLLHGSVGATVSLQYQTSSSTAEQAYYYGAAADFLVAMWMPVYPWGFETQATTVPQVVTFPMQTSGWTSTATFNKFDQSLGHLDSILVTVSDKGTTTFAAENLESTPGIVAMSENSALSLIAPGDTLVADAGARIDFTLGAYDGVTDLAGTSGAATSLALDGETQTNTSNYYVPGSGLTDPVDLRAFSGTGTITLPVSTQGTSIETGPANLFTELTQRTGGTVTIRYVYTPASAAAGTTSGGTGFASGGSVIPRVETVGSYATIAPAMTFLGPFSDDLVVLARPGQTFRIEPGANAFIGDFSIAAGDSLNLIDVLAGVPLEHDLSNLGSFLNVTGQTSSAGDLWNTTLAALGLHGTASLVLGSSDAMSVLDLLNGHALILPAH